MIDRRFFCKSAVAAGVSAAIPFHSATASAFHALSKVVSDIPAVTLSGASTTLNKAAVRELADEMNGPLLTSSDPSYDDVRKVWNGMHDRRPALIARCADIQDVVHAVHFARDHGLLTAVRGGGHSFPGKSVCNGGIMIDLTDIKAVTVDVANKRARIGGGAVLYDLDYATQKHGLATTAGVVSHTGVGGLTLGGGFGRLNRKYGLTIDNLISAEMVTADGKAHRVSANENPDLFWGIRGGGGNFGVVTNFEFRLHDVGPKMLGGAIVWPVSKAREVLEFWIDYAPGLSDDLYIAPFMVAGPDGTGIVGIDTLYAGDPAAGEKELAPLRELASPAEDGIGMVEYMTTQTQFDQDSAPGQRNYIKNGMIRKYSQDLVNVMVESFRPMPGFEQFFHTAGGAVSRVPQDATAWSHRDSQTMIGLYAAWQDPAEDKARIRELKTWWAELDTVTSGYYGNLREETPDRAVSNYGSAYPRLVGLKNRYDPTNLFRLNSNIKPTV
jgi:FAD/FMN-containing dehydrogenase